LLDTYNPWNVKTHIICTIGPATNNKQVMTELLEEGMRVVRCNFSHGDYDVRIPGNPNQHKQLTL